MRLWGDRTPPADMYSLLGAIGHDCVGALQFLPQDSEPTPAGVINAVPVSERQITAILDNLATAPLGITEDESFRICIAGAQEKTALLRWNGRWCVVPNMGLIWSALWASVPSACARAAI